MAFQVLDPNVAYLLLVVGMMLAILALFSPGTGLLEIGALFALAVAGYSIANLTINPWALVVLLVGVFPFLLALRRAKHWFFLLLSIAALIVGSIFMFRSPSGGPAVNPWLASITSILAAGILWVVGRKGIEAVTQVPVHNLGDLMGKVGVARTNVHDEGTIYISGEEWTARANQIIPLGSRVVVVGRDGLTLIVEPALSEQGRTLSH